MLELYHWEPNILFLKPLIALKEKEAEFASRYFDPTRFEQFAAGFPHNVEAGLHLEREGPLLRRNGTLVSSSFFMLEYIAEAFPGPNLNPGGAYEHYRARAWGQFLGLIVGPAVCALGCARYLAPALRQRDQEELKSRIAAIEPLERRAAWSAVIDGTYDETAIATFRQRLGFPVKRVESTLAINRWLTGNEYSIADIDAFAMLRTLPDLAPEVINPHQTPRVSEFLQRMGERPAVRAALAMSRTERPQEAFVPGAEPSRWG